MASKREQCSEKNRNDDKFSEKTDDELLRIYVDKSVELELEKVILKWTNEKLEERNDDLIQEKKKLENLHNEIWNSIDTFCDSAWNFSAQNNFTGFVNDYLATPLKKESVRMKEDPGKIEFLKYQVNNLKDEIKNLKDRIKKLDILRETKDSKVVGEMIKKTFHQKSEENKEVPEIKPIEKKNSRKLQPGENKKKVTFKEIEEKIPKNILKTSDNQEIEEKPKFSSFSVKKKSKIYEKFEKNHLN